MEKLTTNDFSVINDDLKQLIGAKITQTTIINSRCFLFSFSMIKAEQLLISLEHQNSYICLISKADSISTIVSKINDILRKYVRDSYIVNIEQIPNDRIFIFTLQKANELFEKEQYKLIIECIPQRPNLIITNVDNKIIFASHYTSLEVIRPIVQNFDYIVPSKVEPRDDVPKSLSQIKKIVEGDLKNASIKRSTEKFETLFKHIKIRIKSLEKKLKVLDNSIKEAYEKRAYIDHGNMVLTLSGNPEELSNYIKENNLSYDESISCGENANHFFKIYKKSKRTIEMNNIEIEKCKNEIDYLTYILTSSKYMDDSELFALANEILPHKYVQDKKHIKTVSIGSINYNNFAILFGKNSSTNEKLTFYIANKIDIFLHIKDYHGSHIVVRGENIPNDVLLFAAELAISLAGKETGEVYYTQVKNVKKAGKVGLVNLLSYKTIFVQKIREQSLNKIREFKNI